ncbi:BQ5605_C001g00090 [Microbotryum silenes-dioicae]|uniref:BQ5605_C001g00090 protein n=1 Tax=Microbotryum silenes-dioicae TaxID=796604 RepID=A0A2X0M2A1_9BASI|nr:BQ5605_C001g00090 [Microbotryum silenes-dioicae]
MAASVRTRTVPRNSSIEEGDTDRSFLPKVSRWMVDEDHRCILTLGVPDVLPPPSPFMYTGHDEELRMLRSPVQASNWFHLLPRSSSIRFHRRAPWPFHRRPSASISQLWISSFGLILLLSFDSLLFASTRF